ncbi:MAG: hypothetical protein KAI82_14305 [Tritonibacter mobilis]|nr:hypothetical protein [Tritonibacter mobilis]
MPKQLTHNNLSLSIRATKNGYFASVVTYDGTLGVDHVGIVGDDYVATDKQKLIELLTDEVTSRVERMCGQMEAAEKSSATGDT